VPSPAMSGTVAHLLAYYSRSLVATEPSTRYPCVWSVCVTRAGSRNVSHDRMDRNVEALFYWIGDASCTGRVTCLLPRDANSEKKSAAAVSAEAQPTSNAS
jgi:hypothetical protein